MVGRRVCVLSLIVMSGCSGAPGPDPEAQLPEAVPGQAIEVSMQSLIEAGSETERCRFFRAPEGGLWVDRQDVHYTPGSHHVLLFSTPYTEIPTRDSGGHERDTRGVFPCADGAPADWEIDGVVGGAQSEEVAGGQGVPGVALKIKGGTVLLMNTHYLNASAAPLQTDARITLHTVDPASVTQEAGVLFFYNFYIQVPPGGESEARMRCPITRDVTLLDAQSHMHARGVSYLAELRAPGSEPTTVYQSQDWQNVPIARFAPGLPLPAGSSLDYRCRYRNPDQRTVLQGLTTRDEMCMFVGVYFPRDPQLERCALDDSFYTSDLAATHVGHGQASCGDSLACLAGAPGDDQGAAYTACIDASCPAAADALWAAERCRAFSAGCDGECQDRNAPACAPCIERTCAAPLAACRAAGC